jgi:dethiobiotin synthetase
MSGSPILYLTGTNTGVGKTTLAIQLLRTARERKLKMAALKPFCSGGREDAEQLHSLQTAGLTLDEVNPFYFRDPLTPLVAARNEGRAVHFPELVAAVEKVLQRNLPLLIEGAGGLLSPLGAGFSLFDLIQRIPGKVCIVGTNALGVLNGVLLAAHRLSMPQSQQMIVLMNPAQPDAAATSNAAVLRSLLLESAVVEFPFLASERIPSEVDQILDFLFLEG